MRAVQNIAPPPSPACGAPRRTVFSSAAQTIIEHKSPTTATKAIPPFKQPESHVDSTDNIFSMSLSTESSPMPSPRVQSPSGPRTPLPRAIPINTEGVPVPVSSEHVY